MEEWKKKNQIQLRWNENFIRKFVKSLSLINSEQAGRQEIEIFVVSESSVKQFFYRTQFHLYAEEGIAEINPILFRSLEELPDECLCAKKRVVLCDAASYQNGLETEKTKIYPISLKGANIHLYHIAQELHLLNQTLKENFKFEAPYYASITFQDFIDCVNELFPGGVKIDAEKSLDLDGVYINKGEQVMDGNTLLQYARFREDKEGDFGRIRRQQQVIKAISQQLKDVTSIFKLPKAVGKLLGSIQTNLPESVLLDCGMDFLKDNNKKIDTLSVPVDGSWDFNDNTPSGSVLELDLTKNQEAIKKFLNN
ncbi:LCP family protein [Enterococcus faecium]|uniref:LCP family protein n=1 Tax=Enterococcus faecium TaxID=1352 RepID=UPI003F491ABE